MWLDFAWLGLSNFFFCRTDLLGHVLHTISYSNCSGVCCFTCLPLSHYPPLHPLHSCTSFTFSLLSPFSSHFCMALLVIFSIGFTAIFGLIMRAFEIAYLVGCLSVRLSVCLSVRGSVCLASWLAGSPHAASSPRLHLASTFIDLLAWNMWKTNTNVPPPPPLSPFLLFFTTKNTTKY